MPLPEHKLATFQGLLISISGLSGREKGRLADVIARGGGSTSGELNKHCTHLVCKTATGDKWKCAHPVYDLTFRMLVKALPAGGKWMTPAKPRIVAAESGGPAKPVV